MLDSTHLKAHRTAASLLKGAFAHHISRTVAAQLCATRDQVSDLGFGGGFVQHSRGLNPTHDPAQSFACLLVVTISNR